MGTLAAPDGQRGRWLAFFLIFFFFLVCFFGVPFASQPSHTGEQGRSDGVPSAGRYSVPGLALNALDFGRERRGPTRGESRPWEMLAAHSGPAAVPALPGVTGMAQTSPRSQAGCQCHILGLVPSAFQGGWRVWVGFRVGLHWCCFWSRNADLPGFAQGGQLVSPKARATPGVSVPSVGGFPQLQPLGPP